MILLTRKADFSSAHYYWNDSWSEAENKRVFGKCANRNGHGHNYTIEVTVSGEIDAQTGFVVDLKELKDVMHREVVDVYDHRHLNLEIPEFRDRVPTVENIALSAWSGWKGGSAVPPSSECVSTRRQICLQIVLALLPAASDGYHLHEEISLQCVASAGLRHAERTAESRYLREMQ